MVLLGTTQVLTRSCKLFGRQNLTRCRQDETAQPSHRCRKSRAVVRGNSANHKADETQVGTLHSRKCDADDQPTACGGEDSKQPGAANRGEDTRRRSAVGVPARKVARCIYRGVGLRETEFPDAGRCAYSCW